MQRLESWIGNDSLPVERGSLCMTRLRCLPTRRICDPVVENSTFNERWCASNGGRSSGALGAKKTPARAGVEIEMSIDN